MAPVALGGNPDSLLGFVSGQAAVRAAKYQEWSRETGHSQRAPVDGKAAEGGAAEEWRFDGRVMVASPAVHRDSMLGSCGAPRGGCLIRVVFYWEILCIRDG